MCVRQIDPEHGNGFDAILERYQERRAIIEERRQQKAEAQAEAERVSKMETEVQKIIDDEVPKLGKRDRDPNEPLEDGEIIDGTLTP